MGKPDNQQTVTQEIDPDVKQRGLSLFDEARGFYGQNPLQPFGGQRVAGFGPLQEQAFGRVGDIAADPSRSGIAQAEQAAGVAGDVAGGGALMSGIQQFQNPYQQQVIDASMADLDRARQMALGDVSSNATTSGAFGGSRHGVAEAETNRAFADQAARTSAQLRSQGFDRAADLASTDIAQRMRGAGMLSGLGGDIARRNVGVTGLLGRFGGQQQAQAQAGLDAERQEYMEGQQLPMQQYGFLRNMLSGVPYGQTQTTTGPGGSQGAGIAGGALSGASVGSAFGPWGAGIGALGGGLLGLFG